MKFYGTISKRLTYGVAGILLILAMSFLLPKNSFAEPDALTISLGVSTIGEGKDFATQELGLPWNMKRGPYPGPTTVFRQDIALDSVEVSNGWWNFTSNGPNPFLFMHWTSIVDTQEVLKLGDRYPIDTSKYKLISTRLCSDRADKAVFYWFYTKSPYNPSDPNATGFSNIFDIYSGCHVYVFDMTIYPTLQGSWSGLPKGFRFNPAIENGNGINFSMDWMRITSLDLSEVVPIHWNDFTTGDGMYFYATRSACGVDGFPIGWVSDAPSNGTFNWGESLQNSGGGRPLPVPETLEPGIYNIYALVNNTGAPICSPTPLEIRAAPILNFQKPSMFSGPDYATVELGDPWGMSNNEDVDATNDIITYSLNNGIMDALTNTHMNWVELNVDTINTSVYKYITYRIFIEGNQDIGNGWVSRFYWWNIGPGTDPSGTVAQIAFEGWHTFSLDLSTALMLDDNLQDWDGTPIGLRIDPLETPSPMNFHLDYITLTRDEIINAGDTFRIVYELDTPSASVALYYDTDRNPSNGRTLIPFLQPNPGLLETIFLPFVYNLPQQAPPEIDLFTGTSRIWHTTGVAPGTYYISAVVTDGFNTTTWYSELPVIIE